MAARRETDQADPFGVDVPLRGPATDQAHGPLCVEQRTERRLAPDFARTSRHSVFENDAGHSDRIQPSRHFLSFKLPIEVPVAASRTDQHRRSGIFLLRGLINGESWL